MVELGHLDLDELLDFLFLWEGKVIGWFLFTFNEVVESEDLVLNRSWVRMDIFEIEALLYFFTIFSEMLPEERHDVEVGLEIRMLLGCRTEDFDG